MTLSLSKRGINLIKEFEGCKLTAYQDIVGVWTIGFGFTKGVKPGDVMSQEQCEARLSSEVREYELGVTKVCTVPPTQNQFDALVSLAWNIGIVGMQGSSVIRYHNKQDFLKASASFALWNKAGGKVVAGLSRRRAAESALYSL